MLGSIENDNIKASHCSEEILFSKVAIIGAGGIGCELLKNVLLTGFIQVTIIDLDVIDLSNLNRQFLFRKEHVGKPKAEIAKLMAKDFNPNAKIEAIFANIKDDCFNIKWFQQFAIVFSALDNLDARQVVNKMCIIAGIPLIESGTAGFNGQIQPIIRKSTECYNCNPKSLTKTYAVCTIRNRPTQLVHCVVWAIDLLFNNLFLDCDDNLEVMNGNDDAALDNKIQLKSILRDSHSASDFSQKLYNKIFIDDIRNLQRLEKFVGTRIDTNQLSKLEKSKFSEVNSSLASKNKLLSEKGYQELFKLSSENLYRRFKNSISNYANKFNKDDQDHLIFVSSAANIRAFIFGISMRSIFDIKQIAGNIIPAIATTNSMVAAICILQGLQALQSNSGKLRLVFLSRRNKNYFESIDTKANKNCEICGFPSIIILVDFEKFHLHHILEALKEVGFSRDISILNENLLYDVEFTDNLDRKVADLGVLNGSILSVINENESISLKGAYVVLIDMYDREESNASQMVSKKFEDGQVKGRDIYRILNFHLD